MPKQEGQKSKLVTLLRILEQRTDENHRLNVPQLVPEENAIKIAMQKISSGTKRMRPSFRLTAWRTKSPMPSASVMPFSVQASTRIRMGGIISLPPSGTEFMKSLKPITRRGR